VQLRHRVRDAWEIVNTRCYETLLASNDRLAVSLIAITSAAVQQGTLKMQE